MWLKTIQSCYWFTWFCFDGGCKHEDYDEHGLNTHLVHFKKCVPSGIVCLGQICKISWKWLGVAESCPFIKTTLIIVNLVVSLQYIVTPPAPTHTISSTGSASFLKINLQTHFRLKSNWGTACSKFPIRILTDLRSRSEKETANGTHQATWSYKDFRRKSVWKLRLQMFSYCLYSVIFSVKCDDHNWGSLL